MSGFENETVCPDLALPGFDGELLDVNCFGFEIKPMGFFNIFDGDCEPGGSLFIELLIVEDGEEAADTLPDEEEEEDVEEDVEDE